MQLKSDSSTVQSLQKRFMYKIVQQQCFLITSHRPRQVLIPRLDPQRHWQTQKAALAANICCATAMTPTILSDKIILRFRIHDFVYLSQRWGEYVTSSKLQAHGQEWLLRVYPRGCSQTSKDDNVVSAYLLRVGGKQNRIDAKCSIHKREFARFLDEEDVLNKHYTFVGGRGSNQQDEGPYCIFSRKSILNHDKDYLNEEGALVLDVAIQIYSKAPPAIWYPPLKETPGWLQTMMDSAKFSDVSVTISETEFKLHRFILDIRAPALCELCLEPFEPVELEDVDPGTFRSFVRFIYSNEPPSLDSFEEAKAVLLLADRFNCQDLKLFAESSITDKYLKSSNAVELFLFGHAHSCALLKESAMMLCSNNATAVARSEGWKLLKQSPELLSELFLVSHTMPRSMSAHKDDFERMPVADLRDELLKRKREVDGSREMLIKRLKSETSSTTDAPKTIRVE